jgi:RNA polymerase sigma-70 factor, ECF subfamily
VTEDQLVEAARHGSAESFNELVGRYREGLMRFLLLRCRTRADAEDALQDTLVNAWCYLGSYDSRWRFSTWLYRIAIRHIRHTGIAADVSVDDLVDESPDALQQCIEKAERENLWLVARRVLSGDAYAAMWLRYVEDLPLADIARALGRSQAWTKVALMRGRRRLTAEMNDAETDNGR